MISGRDFYNILTAIVPLYVAMMLAYGSVKWWKVFSPAQCSGISRFVALFAVPFLSFHVISSNNPYTMNYRFIGADTLQKVVILVFLVLWCKLSSRGSIEWCITLFALATLPNTLVVGLPLLEGMYGENSGTLMVQIVGLQCIIWYTVLLFLFEYRGAKLLISEEFPETAGSIKSFKLDSDVISLDGKHPLETQSEVMEDGKLLVKVSKSSRISRSPEVSYRFSHKVDSLSRFPDLTDADIYSLPTSRNESSRGSSFNELDSSYLLTDCVSGAMTQKLGSRRANYVNDGGDFKDVCMLVRRSSSAPPIPRDSYVFKGGPDVGMVAHAKDSGAHGGNEFSSRNGPSEHEPAGEPSTLVKLPSINELQSEDAVQGDSKLTAMPPVGVTTKLILITVWRKLVRNPNTYSSLLGLIWSLVSFRCHVQLPEIVAASITILSNTGLGIAMFSLGLFMALQPRAIACGKAKAGLGAVMRFLIGPAVMAASSAAVGLRGDLLRIAIVQAALPGGLVPFVFAQEYNVHADILSTAVMIGMVLTVPITLIYYILLGLVH